MTVEEEKINDQLIDANEYKKKLEIANHEIESLKQELTWLSGSYTELVDMTSERLVELANAINKSKLRNIITKKEKEEKQVNNT